MFFQDWKVLQIQSTPYCLSFGIDTRNQGSRALQKHQIKQNKNPTHLGYVLFTFLSVFKKILCQKKIHT